MSPVTIISHTITLIVGGLLGACVVLWAWVGEPMYETPPYGIDNGGGQWEQRQPAHRHRSPCDYIKTGGIDPDPCDNRLNRKRGTIHEPGTWALLLVGGAGLIWARKNKRS